MKQQSFGFLLVLLISCSLLAFAPQPQNPLTGIWELQVEESATGLLKIFNPDGTVTGIGLGEVGLGISMEGSYVLKSENSYLEKTIKSSFSDQNGTEKLVTFTIAGDSLLQLNYKVLGQSYNETYKRLKLIQEK